MNHIVNNLWLGSQHDADALVQDNPERITAILNVRGPDAYRPPGRNQSAEHPGKAYKWIPAPDIGVISSAHMKEALLWLTEQTANHERILIHCKHGISRSAGFLAAFMVKSGISANMEEARAMISSHRPVQPAIQITEPARHGVLLSDLVGLPNRQAFDEAKPAAFVAVAEVDLMKSFRDAFGDIAGDMLLRRLAQIFLEVGLDAYHGEGNRFLCKGESREKLNAMLSEARQIFRRPFQMYADGRIQTIEGADFSFAIGAPLDDYEAGLLAARRANPPDQYPEWRRRIIATAPGKDW